jgi:PKD repeat protein
MSYQKGFISPLLIVIIAFLLIGGGVYVYQQSKQVSQSATTNPTTQSVPSTQTSSSPTSGVAPLTVKFANIPATAAEEEIFFGDGQSISNGRTGDWPSGGVVHTYATPGTYTVKIEGSMSNGELGRLTIIVN